MTVEIWGGAPADSGGRLAANILHFARVLRAAGLPIGPGRMIDALRAVQMAGIERRDDFYWTLHAVFVNRADQRELFDQAFRIFWRTPRLLEEIMRALLPSTPTIDAGEPAEETSRRIAEALFPGADERSLGTDDEVKVEIDAAMTFSEREVLQEMDFEAMSADEVRRAKVLIARMRLPIMEVATRRFEPYRAGAVVDMRASLRAGLRAGGDVIALRRVQRRRRHPPLVVLCDISGSMSRHSRMFVHFMHAITNDRDRVHTFLFGTRLTNVTRQLRHRDIDLALAKVADVIEDWSGGTRIGACLACFNRSWSRRVLAQGAVVLLISDGLDRDAAEGLAAQMERLHASCRRLIWLNPLLRYAGFEPKSLGIRAMLPYVDDFRPIHNLDSMSALVDALSRPPQRQFSKARRTA